ncbi:hypothetical protein J1614_004783 [Plenodomus biglobosus]|nr:hypothetical protein J1614_004783 [Plenodomus biglobosus]
MAVMKTRNENSLEGATSKESDERQKRMNDAPFASPSPPRRRGTVRLSEPGLYTDKEKDTYDSKFSSDSSGTSTKSSRDNTILGKMRSWLKTNRTMDEPSSDPQLKNTKDVWRRQSEGLPQASIEGIGERARTFPGLLERSGSRRGLALDFSQRSWTSRRRRETRSSRDSQ